MLALIPAACMDHARCDDTLVRTVPSPDKTLEVNIYNRSCKSGSLMTYAVIHDPKAPLSWPRRNDVCILPSLTGGYHALQVVWTDRTHLEVSSPDELDYIDTKNEWPCPVTLTFDFKTKYR